MQAFWAGIAPSASGTHERGDRPAGRLPTGLLLAAGLLAIASCAPRQQGPAITPPVVEPTDEVSTGTSRDEPHQIAILVPLSGANAPVGTSLANAATLALADIQKKGIRLSSYDTNALGARGAAQKALGDGAQLILGPLLSSNVAEVRSVTAPKNVAMLSFSNDSAVAGGNVYILGFQPSQSVDRVVNYVASRGGARFAGLFPNGVYGQRTSVAFTSAVRNSGGQVVAMTSFERKPSALPLAASKVTDHEKRLSSKKEGVAFDSLLIADSGQVAATFMPQLTRFGATPGHYVLMGTELWATEPGLSRIDSLNGAFFATVPNGNFRAMATRYQARYGGSPSRLASLSYDAVLLAASAASKSWKGGTPFPQSVLKDPEGFAGIDGIFRFRSNVAERGLEVAQITKAGFRTVSPAPSGF